MFTTASSSKLDINPKGNDRSGPPHARTGSSRARTAAEGPVATSTRMYIGRTIVIRPLTRNEQHTVST